MGYCDRHHDQEQHRQNAHRHADPSDDHPGARHVGAAQVRILLDVFARDRSEDDGEDGSDERQREETHDPTRERRDREPFGSLRRRRDDGHSCTRTRVPAVRTDDGRRRQVVSAVRTERHPGSLYPEQPRSRIAEARAQNAVDHLGRRLALGRFHDLPDEELEHLLLAGSESCDFRLVR